MNPFDWYNCDCITGLNDYCPPNSVHFCMTSIPFGALFTYSGLDQDVGNCADSVDMLSCEFGLHMRFFVEQLFRAMMPGRIACIHIQQLLTTKIQHGVMGRRDFRAAVTDLFKDAGFHWTGEVVIKKNPQMIAQRQQLHSLQFLTGYGRDACKLAPAINDYVMIYQKPGENPEPVLCLHEPRKNPGGWVMQEEWISWAEGEWLIRETDVVEGWRQAREEEDEKHVCPLQIEPVRRMILLYTNPWDTVLDPFGGIGTVPWVAIGGCKPTETGRRIVAPRRGMGFELKTAYWRQGGKYLDAVIEARANGGVELASTGRLF